VVDSGLMVDPVHVATPNPPRSPDPPRSLRPGRTTERWCLNVRTGCAASPVLRPRYYRAVLCPAGRHLPAGGKVLVGQGGVGAAEEHQRPVGAGGGFHVPDAADDDLVIAAGQSVLDGALEDREHIL